MKKSLLAVCIVILILAFIPIMSSEGKPPQPPPPGQTLPWGVNRIDADNIWDTTRGTGIKVAVFDTGIDIDHPDLAGNIKGGRNFVDYGDYPSPKDPKEKGDPSKYDDKHGHGTAIAGVISAINNSIGVVGVGPEIHLYAVRVRKASGIVYPDGYPNHGSVYNFTDLYEGMRWCINSGIQVINFSLGIWSIKGSSTNPNHEYPLHDKEFYALIKEAYDAGIIMVAAAGNGVEDTNYNGRSIGKYLGPDPNADITFPNLEYDFPASYPEVIAVSATGGNTGVDYFPSFSNYGPAVDVAAPGDMIYTTNMGGGYGSWYGTSLSAPHVVGTVALILKADGYGAPVPVLPETIRGILIGTAETLAIHYPDSQPVRLVDAEAAVLSLPGLAPRKQLLSSAGKLSVSWGKIKME